MPVMLGAPCLVGGEVASPVWQLVGVWGSLSLFGRWCGRSWVPGTDGVSDAQGSRRRPTGLRQRRMAPVAWPLVACGSYVFLHPALCCMALGLRAVTAQRQGLGLWLEQYSALLPPLPLLAVCSSVCVCF